MGKKKVIIRSEQQKWTSEEELTLLAWLDVTLRHPEINFKDTVLNHLDGKYTLEKVEGKLGRLWYKKGPADVPPRTKALDHIYAHGSQSLENPHGLRDWEKEEIAQKVEHFECVIQAEQEVGIWLPNRRLRSASKLEPNSRSVGVSPSPSLVINTHEKRSVPKIQVSESIPKSISRAKNETPDLKRSPSTPSISSRKRKRRDATEDTYDGSLLIPTVIPMLEGGEKQETLQTSKALKVSDTPVRTHVNDSEDSDNETPNDLQSLSSPYRLAVTATKSQTPAEYRTQDASTMADDHNDEKLASARREVENLNNIISEKDDEVQARKNDIEALNRKISAMGVAQRQRDSNYGTPIEEQIATLVREKVELQRKLNDRSELGTFTKLSSHARVHCGSDIRPDFRKMYSQVDTFLGLLEEKEIFSKALLDHSQDLRDLVNSSVGAESTSQDVAWDNLLRASPQALLKVLISSALRRWVFYTDFPNFDGENSHILRGYREHIAKQDGPTALRNLDLATMTTLVRERAFQERTVPNEAKKLANRLSIALAPLLEKDPTTPDQLDWDGFATWQGDTEDVKERRDHLIDLFICALKAKAESCLNIECYEMRMYRPGERYDVKKMDVQTMDGVMDITRGRKDGKVAICVQPALFAFPRQDPTYVDDVSSCVMSGSNFRTREQRDLEPLMKAIVILS